MPVSLTQANLPDGPSQPTAATVRSVAFDLGIWDADQPPRAGEVARSYARLCSGGDATDPPSARVTAFAEECERRWPPGSGDEPGPVTGRRTPRGFVATIRPEVATTLYVELGEMSERHGLVLFDPQSGMVKIPSRLSFNAEPPPLEGPHGLQALIPLGYLRRRRRV